MQRSADSYTACFLGKMSSVGTDLEILCLRMFAANEKVFKLFF